MTRPRRKRRSRNPSKHIVISATDEEWETVKAHAGRRGQSCARYLIGLVKRDAAEGNAERPVVLTSDEQRELLESVRVSRARLAGDGEDTTPFVVDMQVRTAAAFMVFADAMAKKGHGRELHARLARIVGEETAARILSRVAPAKGRHPTRRKAGTETAPTLFDLLEEEHTSD
ncbi:MAG: hypothetical protein OXQ29_00490 [Rhodospirillaceae bacterium]|nr:hypothetical protein [Rhodospirillaceae bacterium]